MAYSTMMFSRQNLFNLLYLFSSFKAEDKPKANQSISRYIVPTLFPFKEFKKKNANQSYQCH